MANNGYLVSGVCSPFFSVPAVCPVSNSSYAATIYKNSGLISEVRCWNSNFTSSVIVPVPSINCEILGPIPPSTIPTVADGITLGWQAGAALILVGCILFLKKALK